MQTNVKNGSQTEIRLFDLFLRGCMAACRSHSLDLRPRQLPTILSIQIELITLNVSVFLINSATVGFWLALPACRCMPKNFSTGSWFILALQKLDTPEILVNI